VRGAGFLLGLLLTAWFATAPSASAQARTFTDTGGRTMIAEIMDATEATVRVRRDDGRVFEIAQATLSAGDREFIAAWRLKREFAFGGVTIGAQRVRLETERTQTRSSTKKDESWCYKLTLTNRSRADLSGLRVEYRVFYVDDTAQADRDELPLKRKAGRTTLAEFGPGAATEVQTTVVELQVTELKPGQRYSGTGKRKVEDSLAGIWVRLYRGGELLHEFADPTTLPKDETW
jgi:hypothetical protein